MSREIISDEVQTREEELSGLFCSCGHLFQEHSVGKCYALIFNGIAFASCQCSHTKPLTFCITVTVEDFEDASDDESFGNSEDSNSGEESSS